MRKMIKVVRFMKYNKFKSETIWIYLYSGYYRLLLLLFSTEHLTKHMGKFGEESSFQDTNENYRYALRISRLVDRMCDKTIWESKCLVRALTAQKLLRKKGIESTIYLGCKMINNKLEAHAWLRCGELYITGGDGKDFTQVAKFSL